MSYKVIHEFNDKKDNNTSYRVGDEYPKTGYKPSKKRLQELSSPHPEHGVIFIEKVDEPKEPKETEEQEESKDAYKD